MEQPLYNLLLFVIPALVTGVIAYLFFREHVENENKRRNFLIKKEIKRESLLLRLQAYERYTLFLERISPHNLLVRIKPNGNDKNAYENLLVATIEQEYEHNLSQQIYISESCWAIITSAKNATIQLIRKANMSEKVDSSYKLQENILTALLDKPTPSNAALSYLKKEISELW